MKPNMNSSGDLVTNEGRVISFAVSDDERRAIAATQQQMAFSAKQLRDQFAMAAMQGWLAAWKSSDDHPVAVGNEMGDVPGNAEAVADLSYRMADAMMARRDK